MDLGELSLLLVLLLVFFDILILSNKNLEKWKELDKIVLFFATFLLLIAFFSFLLNLLTLNYHYVYVRRVASNDLDIPLRIAALWSGASGSFFLWTMFMYIAYIIFRYLTTNFITHDVYRISSLILSANIATFLLFLILKSPFATALDPVANGLGLNPFLSNIFNIIHPPIVLVSYSIFSIPFSIALAMIITSRKDNIVPADLQQFLRFTMALGWAILSTGLLIGGYWAYSTFGWGLFWSWDPVETGSLIPWLFALIYFHGAPSLRKVKGNLGLAFIATLPFLSIIFATIITRTGLLASVHSYSLGTSEYFLFLFIITLSAIEVYFILNQREKLQIFITLGEFKSYNTNDQALYISFLAFIGGTIAIIMGLLIPLTLALLPEPFHTTILADKTYYNVIIGVFGLVALEASMFSKYIFIKAPKQIFYLIFFGMALGTYNAIIGLPIVQYTFINTGFTDIYKLLSIFSTSSVLANYILPILAISLLLILITIIKSFKEESIQRQVKQRKILQSILHVGIIIALFGSLISYNTTETYSVSITGDISGIGIGTGTGTGTIMVGSSPVELKINKLSVLENPAKSGQNYGILESINAQIELSNQGGMLGAGSLSYTIYVTYGLVRNVLIISTLTQDYYLSIIDVIFNETTNQLESVRYQLLIIPMILLLWIGASISIIAMFVLVIVAFKLWRFSYLKRLQTL